MTELDEKRLAVHGRAENWPRNTICVMDGFRLS